ncbi:undecaprenyldiphospho-muramoylpentapeptide beta-N-acetylglucosaminyltransferase [bacterium]|nr:undecaprenyldiphospho-muramoylpentapeptide beta-N-acetylglucosaminyltransferase [candidate division CSSED10-310 bacterium]
MSSFRLVVTGGGTGGHIMPGIAVVEKVRKRVSNARILWVGVKGRREEDLVPRHDIPLVTMRMRGLERSLKPAAILRNARTACHWISLRPVIQARSVLKEFAPDMILGTGGYVCAPVIMAGKTMGIPRWILEQNSVPGLTVKWLARIVDGVGIAYESTRSMIKSPAPIVLVGNPVSESIITASRRAGCQKYNLDPGLKTLLVVGGSLGSMAMNRMVQEILCLGEEGSAYAGWQILHSTGQNKFDSATRLTRNKPRYYPYPFLYRADLALATADMVISRGGAMTLAEITARGVPAVIVPWPGAVRNHQYTNAQVLADAGAALLIPETQLTGIAVSSILNEYREHPQRLAQMAKNSREMGCSDAADKIADLILAG